MHSGFQGLPKIADGNGPSNELKNQLNRRLRLMEQTPEERGVESPSVRISKAKTMQPQFTGFQRANMLVTPRASLATAAAASSAIGLTQKNEELTRKVEHMKERLLRDDGAMPLDERNALLAETDALLEETDRAKEESRHIMEQSPEARSQELYAELKEYKAECQAMRSERAELQEAAGAGAATAVAASSQPARPSVAFALPPAEEDNEEVVRLKEENEALKNSAAQNEKLREQLAGEKQQLQEELDAARRAVALIREGGVPSAEGPEILLRSVLTSRTATIADMKLAVGSAEPLLPLLEEVKRELSRKVLSEKRAAMEVLYEGISKGDDEALAAAIERARTAEVAPEDIEKGEKKLEELRSMTDEQRQAKVAHELEVERKKRAFMLVKRDDANSLKEFIGSLEPDVRWQDWRDYAGRNMWKCSQELGANAVRSWLREELGLGVEQRHPRRGSEAQEKRYSQALDQTKAILVAKALHESAEAAKADGAASSTSSDSEDAKQEEQQPELREEAASAPADEEAKPPQHGWGAVRNLVLPTGSLVARTPSGRPSPEPDSPKVKPRSSRAGSASSTFSEAETKALQSSAQGAVVRDDADALQAVLDKVEVDVWSSWKNKAGKDLLTLSQERGSPMAYSVLAKALGLVTEAKRDTFEERETVWVFFPGEVQPMRATVLEDTPEEAEEIHVELWEGEPGSRMIERCLVRKINT